MADISFTEMGQALDAAAQSREPQASVSSVNQEPAPAVSSGDGSTGHEGNATPPSGGAASQPPKTDNSPSGVADSGKTGSPSGQTDKGKQSGEADDKAAAERRRQNHWYASQRIAAKEAKRRRFEQERERLVREQEAYADEKSDKHNPTLAAVKQDQIRELDIARMQEAQEEWEREARELFSPEDAETFIEDSKNLADWLNSKEPELTAYLDKPYGKHLLKGWMDKIAKNKEAAAQWQTLTAFQKNQIIDNYYRQLEQFGNDYAAGKIDEQGNPIQQQQSQQQAQPQTQTPPAQQQQQQTQQPQGSPNPPPNIPVPNSGRDSKTIPPSNNFGLMLQDAMNKRNLPTNRSW